MVHTVIELNFNSWGTKHLAWGQTKFHIDSYNYWVILKTTSKIFALGKLNVEVASIILLAEHGILWRLVNLFHFYGSLTLKITRKEQNISMKEHYERKYQREMFHLWKENILKIIFSKNIPKRRNKYIYEGKLHVWRIDEWWFEIIFDQSSKARVK